MKKSAKKWIIGVGLIIGVPTLLAALNAPMGVWTLGFVGLVFGLWKLERWSRQTT